MIGAGGRERYVVNGNDQRLAFSETAPTAHCASCCELSAGLRIVRADGHLLDRTTVHC